MSLCDSIDTLAMAYLDDELAAEERHELETHLTECSGCRTELDANRAEHDLLRTALAAPRASDSVRMRLGRALDEADRAEQRELRRAGRRRWTQWVLPGSAILAAAAAILVFVGVGMKPPGEHVGSIAKAGVHQLALPGFGKRSQDLEQFARMELPSEPGSKVIQSRRGWLNGHDAALTAFDVPLKDGRRIVLSVLVLANVSPDEMADGEEVHAGGRTLHIVTTDGHTAVTCVDGRHLGYMFMAEELSIDELVSLVGKTSLVGPQ
jgi:Putative zinc-finger